MSDGLRLVVAALAVSSIAALTDIPREMFEASETPVVTFVLSHYRQYRELPAPATVYEETGVRLPPAPENVSFYADRVYERYQYNQIRDRFAGLREGLSNLDLNQVSQAVEAMHRVTRQTNRRGREILNISQAYDLVQARLSATRGYGGVTGVETGWHGYDRITGGYQRGDLISIVGRPQLGKTYILLKQAWEAHRAGHNVLFVTTEMSAEQIGRRHVSIALGVNPTFLKMNTLSTHMERRISSFYRDMAGAERFNIFSVGMHSAVSAIEAFIQEYDPDIIFIDGAYLLRPTSGGKNMSRTERITGVFDEVKGLTLESDRPVVVSTQFSRAAGRGGADGSLENIGYTDAIGTHSSIVVSLRHGPTTNPKESRWMNFLKGREGEDGGVAINFKFAPLDMDEFSPSEETEADGTVGPQASANIDWMQ